MKFNRLVAVGALIAATGLAGCQSASKALGMSKVVPDEFRVVAKAPLVVPPDYSLRPPAPGEPRPQELQPDSAAQLALAAQAQGAQRSPGEAVLIARAGAEAANPIVRYQIDDESGDLAHKEKSFADKVMFWRKDGAPSADAATAGDAAPVADAAEEEARIKALTGGKAVVISREKQGRIKLPGL